MIMFGYKPMWSSKMAKKSRVQKSKVQASFDSTDEERPQYCFKSLRCRTWIASGEAVLFGIFSQIGSTSGPSNTPAPSHPQHHTKERSDQHSLFHDKPSQHATQGYIYIEQSGEFQGCKKAETGKKLTIVRSRNKLNRFTLLFNKQPIMRTKPRPVLRIRPRVIRQSTQPQIPPDGRQVPPRRMNDRENSL
jgi:hypothetical protein